MVETRFVDMKHFLSVAPPIFYCSPNFLFASYTLLSVLYFLYAALFK